MMKPTDEQIMRSRLPWVSDQGPANKAKKTEGMAWKTHIMYILIYYVEGFSAILPEEYHYMPAAQMYISEQKPVPPCEKWCCHILSCCSQGWPHKPWLCKDSGQW